MLVNHLQSSEWCSRLTKCWSFSQIRVLLGLAQYCLKDSLFCPQSCTHLAKFTVASGFRRAPCEDKVLSENLLAVSIVSRVVLDILENNVRNVSHLWTTYKVLQITYRGISKQKKQCEQTTRTSQLHVPNIKWHQM